MAAENAWRLGLDRHGGLTWSHAEQRFAEPPAGWRKRLLTGLLSYLPVERQL